MLAAHPGVLRTDKAMRINFRPAIPLIIFFLCSSPKAESPNILLEFPASYNINEKSDNTFEAGMSIRYFHGSDQNKVLSTFFNPAVGLSIDSDLNYGLNATPLTVLGIIDFKYYLTKRNKISNEIGLEFDTVMLFSWLVFGAVTIKNGLVNKIIEPYYSYKFGVENKMSTHQIGVRIGRAFPGFNASK